LCLPIFEWPNKRQILSSGASNNIKPPGVTPRLFGMSLGSFTIARQALPHGFKVDTSNDPIETLSNYKPDYYDLVILDIKMPQNGWISII
jgi:CheY-like chemotaxis protein